MKEHDRSFIKQPVSPRQCVDLCLHNASGHEWYLMWIFWSSSLPGLHFPLERQGLEGQDKAELEDNWSQSPELHPVRLLSTSCLAPQSHCCCSAGLVTVDTAQKGCIVVHSLLLLLGHLLVHTAMAHAGNIVIPPYKFFRGVLQSFLSFSSDSLWRNTLIISQNLLPWAMQINISRN